MYPALSECPHLGYYSLYSSILFYLPTTVTSYFMVTRHLRVTLAEERHDTLPLGLRVRRT